MSSTPKHRAEPSTEPSTRPGAVRRFRPMLVTIGALIGVSGVIAGGAGTLGILRL